MTEAKRYRRCGEWYTPEDPDATCADEAQP